MQSEETIETELKRVFTAKQSSVLSKVIVKAYDELVKAGDFNELKGIVKELAFAQKQTEKRVEELAFAQKQTEKRVEELAKRVEELAFALKETQVEIKELAIALRNTRVDLGGVTSTLGYMLENEAYRALPALLRNRYGIEVTERFLRRSIRSFGIKMDGEVNIFSRGSQRGREITVIGEARSQMGKDDVDDLLNTVEKLEGVVTGDKFLIGVTHYARESVVEYAKDKGVEIIQSFEWQ